MNTFLLIIIAILLIVIIILLTKDKNSTNFKKDLNNEPSIQRKIRIEPEVIESDPRHVYYKIHENEIEQNKISNNYSIKNLDIEDKTSIFYNKNVVITGSFNCHARDEIACLIHCKGGAIKRAITSTTNIVIIGSIDPGPAKLIKIDELIKAGSKLQVIQEDEFIEILKQETLPL